MSFSISPDLWPWILFNGFVLIMLALDLGIFHRTPKEIKFKEAITWSAVWIGLALIFNWGLYLVKGKEPAMEFLAGYLIEKSLSVDNVFVFAMIFAFFKIAPRYQHEVLFWGILGAIIMRAGFIAGGVALIKNFHWIIYVFGGFLIITAIKMAKHEPGHSDLAKNPALKLFNRFVPVAHGYEGPKFWVKENGREMATPLFVALVLVEVTDVIFAVDSIPAILAVTKDPFIVYSSNIFAILGLRSLYFALAGVMKMFRYLHYGLAAILGFVGVKMLITDIYKIPIGISLSIIALILFVSVAVSVVLVRAEEE